MAKEETEARGTQGPRAPLVLLALIPSSDVHAAQEMEGEAELAAMVLPEGMVETVETVGICFSG